jgi:SAM-dependent methyltransferase
MGGFWDKRARENAFYFIDNRQAYGDPDTSRFWASGRADLDQVLDAVGAELRPADEIVEIGCGVGRISRELAARGRAVRALDVANQMLELAHHYNAHLSNVEWIKGDGESLRPIGDRSADVCFSHVVFQHIPDPRVTLGYIRETGRVLRHGGWAAFQISNDPRLHQRRRFRQRARSHLRAAFGRGPRGQAHPAWLGSAVDLRELEDVATEAGLEVERTAGSGTPFCVVLLRKRG